MLLGNGIVYDFYYFVALYQSDTLSKYLTLVDIFFSSKLPHYLKTADNCD